MRPILLSLLLGSVSPLAVAGTIYKYVDAQGVVTYSSTPPNSNAKPLDLPEITTISPPKPKTPPAADASKPGGAAPAPTPTPAPTPSPKEQAASNVAEAENQLNEARRQLVEADAIRLGNEKNYQNKLDRLKPFQDRVAAAQKHLNAVKAQAEQANKAPASTPAPAKQNY
jgi:hypothetical protein